MTPYKKERNTRFAYPGYSQSNGFSQSNYVQLINLIDGYRLPNYRDLIAAGQDATTPLKVVDDRIELVMPSQLIEYSAIGQHIKSAGLVGQISADPNTEFGTSSINKTDQSYVDARNIALTYYNKYVKEVTRPFSSQIFLGEIRETLEFLRSPFGKLRRLAESGKMARYNAAARRADVLKQRFRSGITSNPSEFRQVLNDCADAWFEVRFALLPLVKDIATVFTSISSDKNIKKRSSFMGSGGHGTGRLSSFGWGVAPNLTGHRTVDTSIRTEYYIHMGIDLEDTSNLGFGKYLDRDLNRFIEFVPTIYELVPGSWFVDYFVNISAILDSLVNNSLVGFNYQSHTAIQYIERIYNWIPSPTISLIVRPEKYGTITRTRKILERTVQSGPPFQTVRYTVPVKPVQLVNSALFLSRKFQSVFKLDRFR